MEVHLGRPLRSDEIVHHKDGNKLNNNLDNLEITTKSEHMHKHMGYLKVVYCEVCGKPLSDQRSKMCKPCRTIASRKVKYRPSKEELLKLLETNSYCAVGRMYGVSDNAIRKWLK